MQLNENSKPPSTQEREMFTKHRAINAKELETLYASLKDLADAVGHTFESALNFLHCCRAALLAPDLSSGCVR